MGKDKWHKIIDDEIDDIPRRTEKLKSQYWQKAWILTVCTIFGSAIMGFGKENGIVAVGCFLAVTGMVGIFAMAIMCHTQLCLYRPVVG